MQSSGVFIVGLCALVAAASPPNFLILFADDLGYGDLGYTGHPTIVTPNLDRLAAEGMRFTQWYSASAVCSPARAALLTGRYPVRSGTAGNGWLGSAFTVGARGGLPVNETTFGTALTDLGYTTRMIGKWHLGQQHQFLPLSHGFSDWFGIPYSHDMGCSYWQGGPDGCGIPWSDVPLPLMDGYDILEQPTDLSTLSQRYIDHAVSFLETAGDQPFLLYFAHQHQHIPQFCASQTCDSTIRGSFGDGIKQMDNEVGAIVRALDASAARARNTLVIFTSDNGPWIGQKLDGGCAGLFRGGKFDTWEGGIRMPAIARWTGTIKAGSVIPALASSMDIFPTLIALADGVLADDRVIDGVDLSPWLVSPEDQSASPHRCLMIYNGMPDTDSSGNPRPGLWAVRCGAYKAHFYTRASCVPTEFTGKCESRSSTLQSPPLLYQLEHDPSENWPVDNRTTEYKNALSEILAARDAHLASVVPVLGQMTLGDDIFLAPCCNNFAPPPAGYPNCTCNIENFDPFNDAGSFWQRG